MNTPTLITQLTVKSMLQSFHNFFYASFDPGGYVTIDKPVVFWIQTISAKIFGFHGWSVILPQALAGIGSVLLVYVLVKRTFGVWAGRFVSSCHGSDANCTGGKPNK